ALDSVHVRLQFATGACPQAERAVDVQPGEMAACRIRDRLEWIERAGVHVADLSANNRRQPGAFARQRRRERIALHAALVVGGDANQLSRSDAEQSQSADYRYVHFI